MVSFSYVLQDKEGIHARPAGLLVKEAGKYQSDIHIDCKGKSGDAKRIFSVMSLGAKNGEEITISCEGKDEKEAAEAMQTFLKENL